MLHHCFLHCQNLNATTISKIVFQGVTEGLHCASKYIYICMGAHFIRLMSVVPAVAPNLVRCRRRGRPDPIWDDVNFGITSLIALKHQRGMVFQEWYQRKDAKTTWLTGLERMFTHVFAGSLLVYEGGVGWVWEHFCLFDGRCDSPKVTIPKFIIAILRVLQRGRPTVACLSRWTSVGFSLDYFVINLLTKVSLI